MRSIEFSLNAKDLRALAALIGGLNEAGVPFSLRKDYCAIEITISNGF